MTHCCGQPAGPEVTIRVKANQWTGLKEAVDRWVAVCMRIERVGIDNMDGDLEGEEFERRGELADAATDLVENALED